MKVGLFSSAVPVEGKSIIPVSIQLNIPFLGQHRPLLRSFIDSPYFSQSEQEGGCPSQTKLHSCVMGGGTQWVLGSSMMHRLCCSPIMVCSLPTDKSLSCKRILGLPILASGHLTSQKDIQAWLRSMKR